jgi:hypothetical protein
MRRVRLVIPVLTAFGLLLCALPRVAFGAPPDPCALLTDSQVSAVLAGSTGSGKSTGRICRWAGPGGRPGVSPAVVLTMQDARAFDFAKAPTNSRSLVQKPASGVGDDTVFNTIGIVTATLSVKKGDTYFEVHVYGFPVEQTKTIEKTIAQEVISKLK